MAPYLKRKGNCSSESADKVIEKKNTAKKLFLWLLTNLDFYKCIQTTYSSNMIKYPQNTTYCYFTKGRSERNVTKDSQPENIPDFMVKYINKQQQFIFMTIINFTNDKDFFVHSRYKRFN